MKIIACRNLSQIYLLVALEVAGCATITTHHVGSNPKNPSSDDRLGVAYFLPLIKLRLVGTKHITVETNMPNLLMNGTLYQTNISVTNLSLITAIKPFQTTNAAWTNLVFTNAQSTNAFGTNVYFTQAQLVTTVVGTNLSVTNASTTYLYTPVGIIRSQTNTIIRSQFGDNGFILSTNTQTSILLTNDASLPPNIHVITNYTVDIYQIVEPDPNHLYLLRVHPSWWADDTFKVNITTNGLLTSVGVTNSDQTAAVILKLAQLGIQTFELAAGDFAPTTETSKLLAMPGIKRPDFPSKIDVTFNPFVENELKAAQFEFMRAGIKLAFEKPNYSQFTGWKNVPCESSGKDGASGVLYRPLLPYKLSYKSIYGEESTTNGLGITVSSVLLPNEAPVLRYDIRRAFGVTNSAAVTFENGLLKEVYLQKPSQMLVLVDIPLNIAKSVAAIPTDLIQMKINLSNTNATLLRAQSSELTNMMSLIEAQRALIEKLSQTNKTNHTN